MEGCGTFSVEIITSNLTPSIKLALLTRLFDTPATRSIAILMLDLTDTRQIRKEDQL
jgi:hypothetical protein